MKDEDFKEFLKSIDQAKKMGLKFSKAKLSQNDIIDIREISLVQAKDEIVELLSDGKTLYFDEIADILKVDIQLVVNAFKELEKERKLFVDETLRDYCMTCSRRLPNEKHITKNGCLWCDSKGGKIGQ